MMLAGRYSHTIISGKGHNNVFFDTAVVGRPPMAMIPGVSLAAAIDAMGRLAVLMPSGFPTPPHAVPHIPTVEQLEQ